MEFHDYLLARQLISKRQYLELLCEQLRNTALEFHHVNDDCIEPHLDDLDLRETFPKIPFGDVLDQKNYAHLVYEKAGVVDLKELVDSWYSWHKENCQPISVHSTSSLIGVKLHAAEYEKRLVANYICCGKRPNRLPAVIVYDSDRVVLPEGSSIFYIGLMLAAHNKGITAITSNQLLIQEFYSNPVLKGAFAEVLIIGGEAKKFGFDQGGSFGLAAIREYGTAIREEPRATVVFVPVSGLYPTEGPFATDGDVSRLKHEIISASEDNGVRELVFVCDWRKHLRRDSRPVHDEGYGGPVFSPSDWKVLLNRNQDRVSLVTTPPPKLREAIAQGQIDSQPAGRKLNELPRGCVLDNDDHDYNLIVSKRLCDEFHNKVYEAIRFSSDMAG